MSVGVKVPQELIDGVVAELAPLRIILFGSHARGEADTDSDWDLLVILDDEAATEGTDWRTLHAARRGFAGPVDLIPCRDSDFRERSEVVGSLPWIAATEGTVVYERSRAA